VNERRRKKMKQHESFCDSTLQNLYDADMAVFEISSFAASKLLPGRATREFIKEDNIIDFYKLNSFEKWRQKLHDNWIQPFKVDNHAWNSVTHFLLAHKFGEDSKYFAFFTSEANTPLSKDVKLAIAAGSKTGKLNGKLIRPKEIKIAHPTTSKKKYRKALMSKFEQNEELRDILLSTKNAKLVFYKKNFASIIADDLMIIREMLRSQREDSQYTNREETSGDVGVNV
jgi:predicted NAD-dependent protein-ADP-ribosyltransferase YbiA (DUF1768 family)